MNLKYGVVSDVKPGYAKVNFTEDEIVSDWLPLIVRKSKSDKESWQLETNEHVVCLMDEHVEEGVILGAIPNEDGDDPDAGANASKFRKKFSDGTLIEYDKKLHVLTVDVKGDLNAKTSGDAQIDATKNLKATAGLKATITAINIELTGIVKITGATNIIGPLTAGSISAGGAGSGGDGKVNIVGDIAIDGKIEATGDVKAGTVSLKTHIHPGVQPGAGSTGVPAG
jgi:phage baseplate assembly protein V